MGKGAEMAWIVFLFPLAVLIGLLGTRRVVSSFLGAVEDITGITLRDWIAVHLSGIDAKYRWWKLRNKQFRRAINTHRKYLKHVHAADAELLPDELACISRRVWELSRVCRLQLCHPKYSEANRMVVAHWLSRNKPDNISNGDWSRMCPYIITMTFVRSAEELEARRLASLFPMEIDAA